MTAWYVALLAKPSSPPSARSSSCNCAPISPTAVDRKLRPRDRADRRRLPRPRARPRRATSRRSVLSGERPAAQILDPTGRVAGCRYGDPVARAPYAQAAPSRGRGAARRASCADRRARARPAAGPARRAPATRRGRPQMAVAVASMAGVDRSVHRVLVLLLIAGPAALLATAPGGWWLARRALRPIERLTARAAGRSASRGSGTASSNRARATRSRTSPRTLNAMSTAHPGRRGGAAAAHRRYLPRAAQPAGRHALRDRRQPARQSSISGPRPPGARERARGGSIG